MLWNVTCRTNLHTFLSLRWYCNTESHKINEVDHVLLHFGHLNRPIGIPLEFEQVNLHLADRTRGSRPAKESLIIEWCTVGAYNLHKQFQFHSPGDTARRSSLRRALERRPSTWSISFIPPTNLTFSLTSYQAPPDGAGQRLVQQKLQQGTHWWSEMSLP